MNSSDFFYLSILYAYSLFYNILFMEVLHLYYITIIY